MAPPGERERRAAMDEKGLSVERCSRSSRIYGSFVNAHRFEILSGRLTLTERMKGDEGTQLSLLNTDDINRSELIPRLGDYQIEWRRSLGEAAHTLQTRFSSVSNLQRVSITAQSNARWNPI